MHKDPQELQEMHIDLELLSLSEKCVRSTKKVAQNIRHIVEKIRRGLEKELSGELIDLELTESEAKQVAKMYEGLSHSLEEDIHVKEAERQEILQKLEHLRNRLADMERAKKEELRRMQEEVTKGVASKGINSLRRRIG